MSHEDIKKIKALKLKETRMPIEFEDCVANLRMENCKYCAYNPRRGADWKQCALRVKMFLREGGNIL